MAEMPVTDNAAIAAAAASGYIYGLPYIEMARTRGNYLADGKRPPNRFVHGRALAGAANRGVTTPNNDTLYSSAWLDLADGPITLDTPEFGNRYWSVALMDTATVNFAVPGTRNHGNAPGQFLIAPPGWTGEVTRGTVLLRATGRWVWALARIVVDGQADLPAVFALQEKLTLQAPTNTAAPNLPLPLRQDDAGDFFRLLADMLGETPPPSADAAALASLARLGLVPGQKFDASQWPDDQRAALTHGWQQAAAGVRNGAAMGARHVVNGWAIPPTEIGIFGTDYALRASVALGGLAALPPQEAFYMSYSAPDLHGQPGARLVFPPGQLPPADGFWSLTLYERTPEGRQFFFGNALNRYAVGDRSHALANNADGSLEIIMASVPPPGREDNWLPAPVGRFTLVLRLYLPKPDVLSGAWAAPQLETLQ